MLEAIQISKSFPQSPHVLRQVSLSIRDGEFMTLLGPSGCGKTTFLRCVAGLETPDEGQLLLKSKSILELPAQSRPFHMVFQKYALFPHMSVFENIEFSLKNRKVDSQTRRKRAQELLEMMQMPEFGDRKPASLSGGQAQRVALARALADQPQMLLLDEPFSALDEKIRVQLRSEMKSLQKKLGLTFLFVTHDQQEALQMSDRIAVWNQGGIEQLGTPSDLFYKPETVFVAEFLGQKNVISKNEFEVCYLNPEKIFLNAKGEVIKSGEVILSSMVGPYSEVRVRDEQGQGWLIYVENVQGSQVRVGEKIQFSYQKADILKVRVSPS